MSDRQQLADKGTAFCLAALGIIAGGSTALATVLVPAAVLIAIGYEKWDASDRAIARRARKAAEDGLRRSPDFSDADIGTAVALLADRENRIRFEPQRMARAVASGDLDGALFDDAFGGALDDLEPGPRRAITVTLRAAFDTFGKHPKYRDVFTQAMVIDLLRTRGIEHTLLADINEDTRAIRKMVDELVAREEGRAREFGIKEGMLIALARRYAEGNPADFDAALRGVERALEVAAKERQRGQLPANTDDAVNSVIARVDALNDTGDIDAAANLIAEEEARIEAGMIRLYEKGISQAILTRNAQAASAYEVKMLALETADPASQFRALLDRGKKWIASGGENGVNFDLEVAIALTREAAGRARDNDDRGDALGQLGIALATLGQREGVPVRLEEAIDSFRAALEERTRDRVPHLWAVAQSNLGNALATLGEREADTERLEEAVEAYRAALEEHTRDRVPLDWATAHNNLGNALLSLGERETGSERLEEAVEAYRAALEEWTRDSVPLDWATAQSNLGNALKALGEREASTERLEEAVEAYRAALEEHTRDRLPLDWAKAQGNLGNVLRVIGEQEDDTARLEQAIDAYRAALQEAARDRVPLDWAGIQNGLGNALGGLGARGAGDAVLEEAVETFRAALEEHTRRRVPLHWAMTQRNLGIVLAILGQRASGTALLEEAVDAFRAALEECTRGLAPLQWAATTLVLARAQGLIADRTDSATLARSALEQATVAQKELRSGGHESQADLANNAIEMIERIISRLSGRD